jgi:CheY-like chemotaxis protein
VDNGTEAIAEVQKCGYEVAGIDLKMPGINGEELLNLLIKEAPFFRSNQFSLATAQVMHHSEAQNKGFLAISTNPVSWIPRSCFNGGSSESGQENN